MKDTQPGRAGQCSFPFERRSGGRARLLHPKEVAELHEETVRRTPQGKELKGRGFSEVASISNECDGPRDRLVREERLYLQLIGREGRSARVRVGRRITVVDRQVGP